jgi:hypothetical protein
VRYAIMTQPITVDIPHNLGSAAARQKLESGVGQIASVIPGGSLMEHRWEGDTLFFAVAAMGQRVASKIEVLESSIHATIDLPPLVALVGNTIKDKLGAVGRKLLR